MLQRCEQGTVNPQNTVKYNNTENNTTLRHLWKCPFGSPSGQTIVGSMC